MATKKLLDSLEQKLILEKGESFVKGADPDAYEQARTDFQDVRSIYEVRIDENLNYRMEDQNAQLVGTFAFGEDGEPYLLAICRPNTQPYIIIDTNDIEILELGDRPTAAEPLFGNDPNKDYGPN